LRVVGWVPLIAMKMRMTHRFGIYEKEKISFLGKTPLKVVTTAEAASWDHGKCDQLLMESNLP
jgi:hypothetical protein